MSVGCVHRHIPARVRRNEVAKYGLALGDSDLTEIDVACVENLLQLYTHNKRRQGKSEGSRPNVSQLHC